MNLKILFTMFLAGLIWLASSTGVSAQSNYTKGTADTTILRIKSDALTQALQSLKQTKESLEKTLQEANLNSEAKADINEAIERMSDEIGKMQDHLNLLADEMTDDIKNLSDASSNPTDNPSTKCDTCDKKMIEIKDGTFSIHIGNGNRTKRISKDKKLPTVKTQLFGLELGSQFLDNRGTADMTLSGTSMQLSYPKSLNISLYIIREGFSIIKNHLYVTTGIGIDFHEYRFSKDVTLVPKSSPLEIAESKIKFEKNKLSAHYLMIPLMLHVETNPAHPNKSFKLAAGGYGELLVKSYTKQVSEEQGKVRIKDDYNLNKLNYGLAANIGFGSIQFYTHYSLTPLFETNKGPDANSGTLGLGEMYPLTFGIVLNGFSWAN